MESLINFLLDKMYKISMIPKSAFDVKLDIKSENEWNKWIESLNKKYRTNEWNKWLESLNKKYNIRTEN